MGEISRREDADEFAIAGDWEPLDRVFFYQSGCGVDVFRAGDRDEWRTQKRSHTNGVDIDSRCNLLHAIGFSHDPDVLARLRFDYDCRSDIVIREQRRNITGRRLRRNRPN